MAFLSLLAETKNLARAIYEFQHDISNKQVSRIDATLQELVDRMAAIKLINPPLLDVPRRKTRASASASSRFYNSSWLTDLDKFLEAITRFKEVIPNS